MTQRPAPATFSLSSLGADTLTLFIAQLQVDGGTWPCWAWTGELDDRDYGLLRAPGRKTVRAHRFSYSTFVAPLPDELHIDHLCRNHWCVNPRHLEAVEAAENHRRGRSPGRPRQETCGRGHLQVEANVGIQANGRRYCLLCGRIRAQRQHEGAKLGGHSVRWGDLVRAVDAAGDAGFERKQVAQLLGVTPDVLDQFVRQGLLPQYDRGLSAWLPGGALTGWARSEPKPPKKTAK